MYASSLFKVNHGIKASSIQKGRSSLTRLIRFEKSLKEATPYVLSHHIEKVEQDEEIEKNPTISIVYNLTNVLRCAHNFKEIEEKEQKMSIE